MAEQPYRYGQYQQPIFQPASSSDATQPSHFSATSQMPTTAPPYSTFTQTAYEHNANRIPGLGLGNGSTVPPPFLSGVTMNWSAPVQPVQTSQHYSMPQQPHPSQQLPVNPTAQTQKDAASEEGELSEGEFEDLYEPKDATSFPKAASRNDSLGDPDGSSIYDPNTPQNGNIVSTSSNPNHQPPPPQEDSTPSDEDWEPSYQDRERSGSYSPYLSPREVHRKLPALKNTVSEPKGMATSADVTSMPGVSVGGNLSNGTPQPALHPFPNGSATKGPDKEPTPNLSEQKKQALQAILGLVPLKVRYQDYIEEGLDPSVVKALFTELGLDTSVPKPAATVPKVAVTSGISSLPPKPPSIAPPKQQSSAQPHTQAKQDKPGVESNAKDTSNTVKSAAEERKDKIARKLAAMAQKSTSAPVTAPIIPVISATLTQTPTSAAPPISSASSDASKASPKDVLQPAAKPDTTASATPVISKTKAENNALLQQKLAALKKKQAQLAADKALAVPNENTLTRPSSVTSPHPVAVSKGDGHPISAVSSSNGVSPTSDLIPTAPSVNNQTLDIIPPSTEPQRDTRDSSIPGLSVSVPSQTKQSSGRGVKRPVASDFDDYTPAYETLKRTRTDETLIIDVSDDEDVEMDMGSPADETAPPTDSLNLPSRQTLGAFPPLSDTTNRKHRLSPASSSAATPPVRGIKLDFLHKQIEETKRMIAEREAKKAAKQAILNMSPKPSTPAAQEMVSSPKTPRTDEITAGIRNASSVRRDRIVSYELPRITATMKEKQDRLKLIVAQAAQLELELQDDVKEKQKLDAEMEELMDIPTDATPQPQQPSADASTPMNNSDDVSGPVTEPADDSAASVQDEGSDPTPIATSSANDEALQAAISKDNNESPDIPMADASPSTDDTSAESSGDMVSESLSNEQLEPENGEEEQIAQETNKDLSRPDAIDDETALPEVAFTAIGTHPLESDGPTSEPENNSQSISEPPQSEVKAYEPTPAENTFSENIQPEEQEKSERDDASPNEPEINGISEVMDLSHVETVNIEDEPRAPQPSVEDAVAYESPLSYFRAYRFHPRFFDEVPGGLKSMTFSAKIDPMQAICPQVLAGEQCPNGPQCQYQHFDTMAVSDTDIITQLGSADMFVGETRIKFIEGLKRVLNDLKANRVRDFDRITKAIIKHRQEFLDDKTKVLALEPSTT
ncbi:hypothetical protein F5Y16DRAFT_382455 [Xylariaceae sp. FL0255]|nr:hypothetical protein F5Y16DRAFT_382455 [Xylariaceae sp. FL0255]